ncbi:MAG: hypothetical protein KME13_20600 [Myxacorys californica WJT36-NPBG1]|jgi:hypothetical protein|nr:hypothetical protein [Myxacorys californica WJT36-NPBG1]
MNTENDSSDRVADILQRFQTLIDEDLSDDEIETRLKTDFTEEEQKIISETFLSLIEAGETERHFPLDS